VKASFNRWWLLPFGILAASALFALSIVVFHPSFVNRSYVAVAQRVSDSASITDCSGTAANNYACYQQHYQDLVRGPGVEAAFKDLKDESGKSQFVQTYCHQMTHVIGRAALNLYGDVSSAYDHGDTFCWSGYYHGVMEAVVNKIGPDNIQNEADSICADLGGHEEQSFYHYNCVHGLGHGFMAVYDNDLFKSLKTCDALTDDWEKNSCYSGVFMENVIAENNPDHPSKYLKADQPMYPCTDVQDKYKTECYKMQTSYALQTQGYDFGKVFDLCSGVEGDYRPMCYQSLGRDASGQSSSDTTKTKDICMLGKDDEARSNCVDGAVKDFISYYNDDTQAKEFCGSLDPDLSDECLKTGEEYYKTILQA
jgi:hypothetical protein